MTHPTYTQQALCCYTLPRLKRIATELGVTPTGDKRGAETWINAIITHQSTQIQKAQAIAPEKLTTVEISFYDHEFYAASKLIASITHDEDLTQPWLVMVNGAEKFRANTWARCHRFIQWHLNNSQLPSRNSQLNSISKSREFASLMNQSPHHIDNCELRIANCLMNQSPPKLKYHVPPRTESWRRFSTSAKNTALKSSTMGFIPVIANWAK